MRLLIIATLILNFFTVIGQNCPVDETDLANGGTFWGPCSLEIGSTINITGNVTWTGDTLRLTGSGAGENGSVYIENGGSLTVQSGTILVNDFGTGTMNVREGGALIIENGASVITAHQIRVWGTMDVSGSIESEVSRLEVKSTGVTTIYSGGGIMTTRGTGDNYIEGTLNIYGSMLTYGDVEVNGGSVTVFDGADLTIGDPDPPVADGDLLVYGGGSFMVEEGASVIVEDDVVNGDEVEPITNPVSYNEGQGMITINGDLYGGGDLQIYDTTPDSNLGGSGNITIQGSFADEECPDGDFCFCGGGGDLCNSLLPVELISFDAEVRESVVLIEWETSSELNNDYFTLYHSNNGDHFSAISKIQGNGTSTTPNKYVFEHYSPQKGNNFYKLSQTDFDGTTTDYESIFIEFESERSASQFFPNPLPKGQLLHLIMDSVSSALNEVAISVVDASGREIGSVPARRKSDNLFVCNIYELGTLSSSRQMVMLKLKGNANVLGRLFLEGSK